MGKKSRKRMTELDETGRVKRAEELVEQKRQERLKKWADVADAIIAKATQISTPLIVIENPKEVCLCKSCLWVEDKILCDSYDENCMDKKCEDCTEQMTECSDYKNEKETVKVGKGKEVTKKTVQKGQT